MSSPWPCNAHRARSRWCRRYLTGPYHLEITVGALLLISYANLRGMKEAGRIFAVPVYSFIIMLVVMIVTGVVRQIFWGLPQYDATHIAGSVPVHQGNGLIMGATVLVLLRAFANGDFADRSRGNRRRGECLSKPQGPDARRVLTRMACILGFLLVGVIYLVHAPTPLPTSPSIPRCSPRSAGRSSARHVGSVMYVLLQTASAAILFFGANTSFNGFPALPSFVAEDSFLPRPMMKRGHRLVFSNAIIVLTALAVTLVIVTGGSARGAPAVRNGRVHRFQYGLIVHDHDSLGRTATLVVVQLVINLSAGILSTSGGLDLRGSEVH